MMIIFEVLLAAAIILVLWKHWNTLRRYFALFTIVTNVAVAGLFMYLSAVDEIPFMDAISASFLHMVVAILIFTFLRVIPEEDRK